MVQTSEREAEGVPERIRRQLAALIDREDRSAELTAGLVRIATGAMLGVVALTTSAVLAPAHEAAGTHYRAGMLVVASFVLSGVVAVALARSRMHRREHAFAFLALDAALIGTYLDWFLDAGLPGDLAAAFPGILIAPLLLTVSVLRVRPGVQAFGLAAFAVVLVAVVAIHGSAAPETLRTVAGEAARLFTLQPNIMRFVMFVLVGALLVMAAHRGRKLLVQTLVEGERRAALTKFLPAELTPLVTGAEGDTLIGGRRHPAAMLFVDIRDFAARAESMDPRELSAFITSFRRRVMEAAERHGGVVDKFIGDGALVVFGVPAARHDDASRALACARTLLDLVDRWNREASHERPVRIGIGVHFGEVFFGVVGDERRKELTVLGDAVNVAARLEQATKTIGTPLLASAEIVHAAGEAAAWIEVAREPLRGRESIVQLMRPVSA